MTILCLSTLPNDILVHICVYVHYLDLCSLNIVCKTLCKASNSEEPWMINCKRLWFGKANMPFSYQGAPQTYFKYIRLTESYLKKCSIKVLRNILFSRDVNIRKLGFVEKSEFRRKVIETQPKDVVGFTQEFNNVWKASLVYSIMDSKRTIITQEELCSILFATYSKPDVTDPLAFSGESFSGKLGAMTMNCQFHENGVVKTDSPTAEMRTFHYTSQIHNGRHVISVPPYPPLIVFRDKHNWRWVLEGAFVRMISEYYGVK